MSALKSRLSAGSLDRRVRIEHAVAGDDGYNETQDWAELATVAAQVIPQRGQEARGQLGRDERLTTSFRIRWSSRVAVLVGGAGRHRLRYPVDGQAWDILSATEIGRREGIEVIAVARVAA